ncbi:MAG: ATP-binding protein [Halomonas sp.]
MRAAPVPEHDEQRLAALYAYQVLDTPEEPAFERIIELVCTIFEAPIAAVTLIDRERQWFKAQRGLCSRETAREVSFCGHVVAGGEALVVPDTYADERFQNNPLVTGPPYIRAYLGLPLTTPEGHHVGVLCIQDTVPRAFSERDQRILRDLAAMTVDELELRKTLVERSASEQRQRELSAALEERAKEAECLGEVALCLHRPATRAEGLTAVAEHLPAGFQDPARCRGVVTYAGQRYPLGVAWPEGPCCRATVWVDDEPVGEVAVGWTEPPPDPAHPFLVEEGYLMERVALLVGQYLQRERIHEELEEANRVKNDFLNAVSHDLRTPLNAMLGFTEMLAGTELDERQRGYLAKARRAGHRLRVLIDMLLDLSRLERGRLRLAQQPFDLLELTRRQIELLEPSARQKGLTLELDAAEQRHWQVVGDRDRFGQVVSNLVGNAVKFTEHGGVYVSLRSRATEWIELRVVDTGPGIPEAEQERIFDWFTQGSQNPSHVGGLGLGLRICLELVRLMGGALSVANNPEGGACFKVLVPLPPAVPLERTPRLQASAPADTRTVTRVLVADDDPVNAELARLMLEQAGAQVTVVHDGEQALAVWEREPLDHLLLDVQMPRLDGPGVVRAIRAQEHERGHGRRTPITILTAHVADAVREECNQAGADAYLTKPIQAADLRALLKAEPSQP